MRFCNQHHYLIFSLILRFLQQLTACLGLTSLLSDIVVHKFSFLISVTPKGNRETAKSKDYRRVPRNLMFGVVFKRNKTAAVCTAEQKGCLPGRDENIGHSTVIKRAAQRPTASATTVAHLM